MHIQYMTKIVIDLYPYGLFLLSVILLVYAKLHIK